MDEIAIFDNSMLGTFRLCNKKFFWRMIHHLVPRDDEAHAFKPGFGSALHDALEAHHGGLGLEASLAAFDAYWNPFEGQDKTGNRTRARGHFGIALYAERYPVEEEPFTVDKLEIGFAVELSPDIIYCGRSDGLVIWKLPGVGYVALEHKSSASRGYLSTKPNNQASGYLWSVSQLTGQEVNNCLFNILYFFKPTKTSHNISFNRELTHRTPEELEEWRKDTIDSIDQVNSCIRKDRFPKNTDSCGAFFRSCEYKELCCSTSEIFQRNFIEENMEVNAWDPYPQARSERQAKALTPKKEGEKT